MYHCLKSCSSIVAAACTSCQSTSASGALAVTARAAKPNHIPTINIAGHAALASQLQLYACSSSSCFHSHCSEAQSHSSKQYCLTSCTSIVAAALQMLLQLLLLQPLQPSPITVQQSVLLDKLQQHCTPALAVTATAAKPNHIPAITTA